MKTKLLCTGCGYEWVDDMKDINKMKACLDGEIVQKFVSRPAWDDYFLNICKAVAERADCRRAQHGCVIVNSNRIVATGYNGSPSGGPSCLAGECPRGLLSNDECASLSSYENCIALHAEQNAIAYSNRADCIDATLYVTGAQCDMCEKLTRAAGIRRIVWPDGEKWV